MSIYLYNYYTYKILDIIESLCEHSGRIMGFFQAAVEVGVLYVAVFAAFEYVF